MPSIDELYVSIGAQLDTTGFTRADRAISAIGEVADRAGAQAGAAIQSLAATVASSSGRYVDSAGKMREANGRFVSSATLAAEAAKEFGGAAASASNGFEKFANAGQALQGAGSALSLGLSAPIAAAGIAAITAAGDMQALEKGFTATYKGAEPLADALAKVQELAKLPGLGLQEALQGATNLQAAGFSAELARRSLGAFGNALATVGRGKADLEGVQLALGQIASKGKISAEEIGQLAERVPQIRGAMQAAFNTSDTEVLQKMGIGATEFVERVTAELEKLPKVTGGINNSFENLTDSISKAAATVGGRLNKLFNIEGAISAAGDFIDELAAKFNALPDSAQSTIFALAGLAAAVGPLLVALGTLGAAASAIVGGLGAIGAAVGLAAGPVALIAVAVAAAAVAIVSNWSDIVSFFTTGSGGQVFGDLATSVGNAVDAIQQAFAQLGGASDTFGDLVSVGGVLKALIEDLGRGITAIVDVFTSAVNSITALFRGEFITSIKEAGNVLEALTRPLRNLLGLTSQKGQTISEFFDIPGTLKRLDELAGEGAVAGGDIATGLGRASEATGKLNGLLQELQDRLKAAKEAQANAADEKTLAATNLTIASLERQIKRLQELGIGSQEAAKAMAALQEALRVNASLSTALGNSYDYIGGRAKALQSGIESYIKAGINPESAAVQGLLAQLRALPTAYEAVMAALPRGLAEFKPVVLADVKVNPLDDRATQQIQQQLARLGVQVPPLDLTAFNASAEQLQAVAARLTDLPDAGGLDVSDPILNLSQLQATLTKLTGVAIGPTLPELNTKQFEGSVNFALTTLNHLPAGVAALQLPPLPPLPAFDRSQLEPSVAAIEDLSSRVVNATTGMSNAAVVALTDFNTSMQPLLDSIGTRFGDLATTVAFAFGGVIAGVSSIQDAMRSALAGALGVLSDFLKEYAKKIIALGVANLAINPVKGALQIAGGIALAAAAGSASAYGNSLTSSGGSKAGAAGGGAIPTAPASTYRPPTAPVNRTEPAVQNNTQVVNLVLSSGQMLSAVQIATDRMGRVVGAKQIR